MCLSVIAAGQGLVKNIQPSIDATATGADQIATAVQHV